MDLKTVVIAAIAVAALFGIAMLGFLSPASMVQYPTQIKSGDGASVGNAVSTLTQQFNPTSRTILFGGTITTYAAFTSSSLINDVTVKVDSYNIRLVDTTSGNYVNNDHSFPSKPTVSQSTANTLSAPLDTAISLTTNAIPTRNTDIPYRADIYVAYTWTGRQLYVPFSGASVFKLCSLSFNVPGGEASQQIGNLGVNTGVSGVTISLSGASTQQKTSTSAYTTFANIPAGSYSVKMERAGYNTQTLSATVSSGTTTDVAAGVWQQSTVDVKYGNIRVNTGADPVTVVITGYTTQTKVSTGQVALFTNVQEGQYSVKLSRDGYITQVKSVWATEGTTSTVNNDAWVPITGPPPTTGSIIINTRLGNEGSVTITVSSISFSRTVTTSETTVTMSDVPQGKHTIKLTREGYDDQTDTVYVIAGDAVTHVAGDWDNPGSWDWMPLIICAVLGLLALLVLALPYVPGPLPIKILIGIIVLTVLLVLGFMLSAGMISWIVAGALI